MKQLLVDRSKLVTVKNYADIKGITPQHVYNLIKSDDVQCVVIDGVKFIHL